MISSSGILRPRHLGWGAGDYRSADVLGISASNRPSAGWKRSRRASWPASRLSLISCAAPERAERTKQASSTNRACRGSQIAGRKQLSSSWPFLRTFRRFDRKHNAAAWPFPLLPPPQSRPPSKHFLRVAPTGGSCWISTQRHVAAVAQTHGRSAPCRRQGP